MPHTPPDAQRRYLLGAIAGAVIAFLALAGHHVVSARSGHCGADGPLTVLGGRDASGMRGLLIGRWRGLDGMRAEFRELPTSTDLQHSEIVSTARSGVCGADVYVVDTPWIPELAKAGYIDTVGVPERDLRQVIPSVLDTGRYQGKLWAVPLNTDAPLLIYRKDLVKNVPRDRGELMAEAAALMRQPGTRLKSGLALQLSRYEGLTVNILELIRDHGGDITVSEDGKVRLDRRAVLATLRDLSAGLQGDRPLIRPESLDSDEDKDRVAFENGDVAFMRNWPTHYTLIANNGKLAPEQVGAVPYPGERVLGGQSLAVAAGLSGDRARAARDLIGYLNAPEQQRRLFACGGLAPVRTDVYRTGSDECPDQVTSRKRLFLHADAQVIYQAVTGARPRPSSVYYPEFSGELRVRIRERLKCMQTECTQQPSAFLDELTSALERAAHGRVR
ncbi:extracellular solute-binding protein [Actinomadura macra]|uniref:extracellular solute-binding protein n=1 Tax=Actinomadura macra TaxID=46164 RepID=UPI00082BE5EB|nr:extracellular solute-binding protein [Actinomadura macra]